MKTIWQSKTVWLNLLIGVAFTLLQQYAPVWANTHKDAMVQAVPIVNFLNLLLRLVTKQGITIKENGDQ